MIDTQRPCLGRPPAGFAERRLEHAAGRPGSGKIVQISPNRAGRSVRKPGLPGRPHRIRIVVALDPIVNRRAPGFARRLNLAGLIALIATGQLFSIEPSSHHVAKCPRSITTGFKRVNFLSCLLIVIAEADKVTMSVET